MPPSHKADEATHSKMAKSNAPVKQTHADAAGDAPAEKVAPKRQRRPSVRLGEIGGYQSSDSNRKVTNKSQNNGKQLPIAKIKDSKNVSAKNSEVYETLGGEKEGKLDRIETGRSKKSFMKRIRSDLVNVDDKFEKDGGDEFRVTDSESPVSESGNLEIEKQGKLDTTEIGRSKRTKRTRSDRVSVEKFSGGKDGDDGEFRVSDSESPEREDSPVRETLEIENGDHGGNRRNGVRKGVRVVENGDEPSENGDEERNGVKGWLDQLGLGRYGPVFDVHEVDEEVLPLLTLEDLKDMGINAVGSRRKIYAHIQKLRE